jgi:rhodanese-related sulfurtransferase
MALRKGFQKMVDEAKSRIKTLTLDEARAKHSRPDVLFVDLRDVRELEREGQIPGAFHCPRGMLEFWIDPDSPYYKDAFAPGKELVFFCNASWRSALAADTAQQMGVEHVSEMDGGFTAWKKAGLPVEERPKKKA